MNYDGTVQGYVTVKDNLELLRELPDGSADLIIADPPYNLSLAEWDSYTDYADWSVRWIRECYRVLKKDGNMVIFGGTQFGNTEGGDLNDIIYYLRHYTDFRSVNKIIWCYDNGKTARRYFASRFEEIFWIAKSENYYFNPEAVRYSDGRDGKDRLPSNVWNIRRVSGNSPERTGHPTQKPAELIRRIVRSMSGEGSVVLDIFSGSGVTGRVCIEENRNFILCDSDEKLKMYFKMQLKNMRRVRRVNYNTTAEWFIRHISEKKNPEDLL